jgi:hypothetical protein
MPRTTGTVGPRPKPGTRSPAFAAAQTCLASASTLLLALTAGCAGEETVRLRRPSCDESTALEFYERSVQELTRGEYVPALTDVHRAERLCRAKDLRAKISLHKADILNHVRVFTTVEERSTLRYTLLYSDGDVYRSMGGLEVKFAFFDRAAFSISSTRR